MVQSIQIDAVLENMDWNQQYQIPVANKENRQLELKNLIDGRRKDLESIKSMIMNTERQEGRIKQEMVKLEMNIELSRETKNDLENKLFLQHKKIESKRAKLNWDKNVLEAWLEESMRKDEDVSILEKYIKMDETKIKELTMEVEKLTLSEIEKKSILTDKTNKLQNIESELEKCSRQFRLSHSERQRLLDHWEEAIKQMHKRDEHIRDVVKLLDASKSKIEILSLSVSNKSAFNTNEKCNNTEKQNKINALDRLVTNLKFELHQEEDKRDRFTSETNNTLKVINSSRFIKIDQKNKAQRNKSNLVANIENSQAALRSLNSQVKKTEENIIRQQEIIYNQDFTIQHLEQRIARLQGETKNEEKVVLEEKIKDLKDELKSKKDSRSKLNKVIQKLRDNIVKDNLLRLELKKLEKILDGQSSKVTNLKCLKLQLDTASKERRNEIELHKQMLNSLIKSAEAEKSQVTAELHDRRNTIDKLKRRYEILTISMAPPEGKEECSQAYYIIKAAQEKEEVQKLGDDLESKINKTTLEITALQNTLNLVNGKNEIFRKCFNVVNKYESRPKRCVGIVDSETLEQNKLDQKYHTLLEKNKVRTYQLKDRKNNIRSMELALEKLSLDFNTTLNKLKDKEANSEELVLKVLETDKKIERANDICKKIINKITGENFLKENNLTFESNFYHNEIDYRYNKRKLKEIVKMIQSLTSEFPKLTQHFDELFRTLETQKDTLSITSMSSSIKSGDSSIQSYRSSGSSKSSESTKKNNSESKSNSVDDFN
ncbi:Coiled-coil domain-containing protein 39 [Intoshia linei]|uniref:Coiled-coil domain-containing protein 39 n=1 Tax=Intoshia linei TaxID=1819745 RepID=A0A177B098_9BILA|nr:Coiled-coil domain-containing protein 39 [Intoshia linei]